MRCSRRWTAAAVAASLVASCQHCSCHTAPWACQAVQQARAQDVLPCLHISLANKATQGLVAILAVADVVVVVVVVQLQAWGTPPLHPCMHSIWQLWAAAAIRCIYAHRQQLGMASCRIWMATAVAACL